MGKTTTATKYQRMGKNAVEADRKAVFLTLTANAVREYFNLIGINQKLSDNQNAQKFQQKQRHYLQTQLKLGLIAQADLLVIEQTLNNLQQTQRNLITQKMKV